MKAKAILQSVFHLADDLESELRYWKHEHLQESHILLFYFKVWLLSRILSIENQEIRWKRIRFLVHTFWHLVLPTRTYAGTKSVNGLWRVCKGSVKDLWRVCEGRQSGKCAGLFKHVKDAGWWGKISHRPIYLKLNITPLIVDFKLNIAPLIVDFMLNITPLIASKDVRQEDSVKALLHDFWLMDLFWICS